MRLFIPLLLLLSLCATAQNDPQVQVTLYNESNGGPTGLVNCMLQAKNGYLWVGCSNGLMRFDGYVFTPYANMAGFPANVTHLAEDREQNIWMSFPEGRLAKFDPANGRFTNFVLPHAADPEIASVQINALYFDRENGLWLGTAKKGLLKVDIQKNTTIIYPLTDRHRPAYVPAIEKIYNTVYGIREDDQQGLLLATHDGLYRLANAGALPISIRPAAVKPNVFRKDLFNDLLPDGDSLWLGAWGGGLSCSWPKTGRWENYLPDPQNFGKGTTNIINHIGNRNKEELWICSGDKGLGLFNKYSKSFYFFRDYRHSPDLPENDVTEMTVDKEGNAWAVHNRHLLKLQLKDTRFYFTRVPVTYTDNQNNYEINDVWEDDTLRLIATGYADGLHVMNKHRGTTFILKVGILPKEETTAQVRQIFHDRNGRIWIVTRDFIYRYDRRKNKLVKPAQPPLYTSDSLSNHFSQITADNEGKLWIATRRNGVFVCDGEKAQFEHFAMDAPADYRLPSNAIHAIVTDQRGRVWLGSREGMLGYVSPPHHSFISLPAGQGSVMKMPGNKTYTLYADEVGNIWAGTTTGLYFFECATAQPHLQKIIGSSNGLLSESVYGVVTDRLHNMWCLTDAGLSFLPKGGTVVTTYAEPDGIEKGTGIKIVRTSSDTMCLLTYAGYYRFVPTQVPATLPKRPLVLTAMQVNARPFYFEAQRQKNGIVHLGTHQNFFSFEFAALNYDHPETQQYAYMLEGIDKDWVYAGNRRFVSYTNVPGGRYTFKVKTVEPNEAATPGMLSVPLFIATPFYRTIPFYCLLVFAIAALMYGLYRSRIAHLNQVFSLEAKAQALEKEKALVMYEGLKQQLNPHFLFNALTSLNSLIVQDPQTARNFLEQLSSTYRYILKNREKELIGLWQEVEFARTYIQLQQTRFKEALQVKMAIDKADASCKIVPVTLQNLIENAIKHNVLDKDTPLIIDIYTADGYLVVRNNLQKKKIVETSNKEGLRSMKTLYAYLTEKPLYLEETTTFFTVRIPLLT